MEARVEMGYGWGDGGERGRGKESEGGWDGGQWGGGGGVGGEQDVSLDLVRQ